MQKVALIFSPHQDDVEFGCSFYYMSLLEQGYRVIQVSMTDGAFGTTNPDFKGKRLVKIRANELDRANGVFEEAFNSKIEIIRLGYTDGYLPLSSSSRKNVMKIIQKYNPDIVFAPDPWYSQDYHPDHINTGRLVTFALKKLAPTLKNPIPLILYYTFAPNRFITVKLKYIKVLQEALLKYQSQISPFGVKLVMKLIRILVLGKNFLKFQKKVKGYRFQEYNLKNEPIFPPPFEENSILHQIKHHLFHLPDYATFENLHDITPEELGIEIKK
jgi:LmbE family N-acetylglucosaminyl deacetylase